MKKKLSKILKCILIVAVLLITGCTRESDANTYKVAGDEYHNYIEKTVQTIIDQNNDYSLNSIASNYPYINVSINYNSQTDEISFDDKNKEVANQIFTEFKKSKFKGNIGYEYNIISLSFKGIKENCSDIICEMNKNIQIDVLKINEYESFDDYYHDYYKNSLTAE